MIRCSVSYVLWLSFCDAHNTIPLFSTLQPLDVAVFYPCAGTKGWCMSAPNILNKSLRQVQRIQASAPYIDIYTKALSSPLRLRPSQQIAALTLPNAHREPKRWENPSGWGAGHVNDEDLFNLWDEQNREFRLPKGKELEWVHNNFGDCNILMQNGWGGRIFFYFLDGLNCKLGHVSHFFNFDGMAAVCHFLSSMQSYYSLSLFKSVF